MFHFLPFVMSILLDLPASLLLHPMVFGSPISVPVTIIGLLNQGSKRRRGDV